MVRYDYLEKIPKTKRRWHMWEGNFHFRAAVSKQICGIDGCSQPAMGRNRKHRYILYPLIAMFSILSHCELTQLEEPESSGTLIGVQAVNLDLPFGYVRNKMPGWWEKKPASPWRRWVMAPTRHLGWWRSWLQRGCGAGVSSASSLLRLLTSRVELFLSNKIHRLMLGKSQKFSSK